MKLFEKNKDSLKDLQGFKSRYSTVRVYEEGRVTKKPDGAILVLNDYSVESLIANIKENRYQSVIPRQEGFEENVEKVARVLSDPNKYFSAPEEVIYSSCNEKIRVEYMERAERDKIIQAATFFTQAFNSSRVSESTRAVVEEIFMNSMFDAPREYKIPATTRKKPSHWREVVFARNEDSMIVSGLDLFGSLETAKFLARLLEVESRGAGTVMNMNEQVGGAGIGCHILFSHSSNLWLGVEKGKQTRVTCEIPLGLSHRKMAELKKGLHIIKL